MSGNTHKINHDIEQSIFSEQYQNSLQSHVNPVIVIPGILGSQLVNKDESFSLWGDFRRNTSQVSDEQRILQIALPIKSEMTLDQIKGNSIADGSVRKAKVSVAGLPLNINIYGSMMEAMGVGGQGLGNKLKRLDDYIDDKRDLTNAFEFSYDSRRSIDENAIELGIFIQQISRYLKLQRGNKKPIKFDIVAHSMGGLIARYFLRYGQQLLPADGSTPILNWSGSANIKNVIIIGTPNGGSLFALERLVIGLPKSSATPGYDPLILGTMPSVYQLLPRSRHNTFQRLDNKSNLTDFMNIELWQEYSWGLANKKREKLMALLMPDIDSVSKRKETAMEHLEKCLTIATGFQKAMDKRATPPAHLNIFLFVGDTVSTPLIFGVKKGESTLTTIKRGAGDGTVSRASVLLDERLNGIQANKVVSPLKWDNVIFLDSNHLGLTKNPVCVKNILYILLERP
ncbi:MAG: hypothetical protein BA866_10550 [Desulfobulbaceae bacterium S5133MH15]|nr:MAG: hypothetical protein BA866_10550 [Desulfobulbaceae bacterium S5133MH15]